MIHGGYDCVRGIVRGSFQAFRLILRVQSESRLASEDIVNLYNREVELASHTGRELGLPALKHQLHVYPTTQRALRSVGFGVKWCI